MNPDEIFKNRLTSEDIAQSRALAFGGSGASLAIVLLVAQIGVAKASLVWSLTFAAAAIPFWLALALSYDAWLTMKLSVDDLHLLPWLRRLQTCTFLVCIALAFASLSCLLYSLSRVSALVFVCASILGLFIFCTTVLGAFFRLKHLMK
jgi:hypothetical protein